MKYALALLLVAAAAAWGQQAGRDDDGFPPPGSRHSRMMEQLKLTDDQQDKIDKLRVAFEKKQIATRAQLASARVDLRELYRADKPDRSAVEGKIREIDRIAGDLRLGRVDHWFDVYELLTPEQQKVWRENRMAGAGRMGEGMMRHRMFRGRGDGEHRPMDRGFRDE